MADGAEFHDGLRVGRPCIGCPDGACAHLGPARWLDLNAWTAARAMSGFARPAAVTENAALRVTQIAGYAAPMHVGGPLRLERDRVCLRLDPAMTAAVFRQEGMPESGTLPSLSLRSSGGRLVHACHTLTTEDSERLRDLAAAGPARPAPRGAIEGDDQLGRLDALLSSGAGRAGYLPHGHVDPSTLRSLIDHLILTSLPVGVAVLSGGVGHIVQGDVRNADWTSPRPSVAVGDAIIEVALAEIRSSVVVRLHGPHGATHALEFYDADHRCVAVIGQFGLVPAAVHEAWERIVRVLPAERDAH